MAFEAFLTQDEAKPTAKRSLLITASLIAHGALLTGGVIYSFWHVDELSPPTVTVTFLANAPPPPPPPAAKKKRSDTKRVTREVTQPKPNELTQPVKEEQKQEEQDDGVEGGVEGGVAGGVLGGFGTGTPPPPANEPPPPPPPPAKPKTLPPTVGLKQLAINPRVAPYNLVLPPNFPTGMKLWALTQICVNPSGNVMGVSLVKGMDPKLDGQLTSRIRSWKFNPLVVEGRAIPFCFTLRYEKVT